MRALPRSRSTRVSAAAGAAALTAGVALQRRFMKRIERDPERAALSAPPEGQPLQVRAPDGTVLQAQLFGPEQGATVVLAHGWTESHQYWTYQIRDLSDRGLRVVAYDMRGHGDSQPAVGDDYSIERFGEDVEAVLSAVVPEGTRAVWQAIRSARWPSWPGPRTTRWSGGWRQRH